jgi:hypothetical protein
MAERKPLTEEEFKKAENVYLVGGKDPIVPKPDWNEEPEYFDTPAPDGTAVETPAVETPAVGPPAVETPAVEGAGAVVDKVKLIKDELTIIVASNQVENPLTKAPPASAADIKAGIKMFVDNLAPEHKYEPAVPGDAASDGAGTAVEAGVDGNAAPAPAPPPAAAGGRRRTKRKGHKGRKGSNNKKQQQSSQNGGRRSCKNRRKQSRRRKH